MPSQDIDIGPARDILEKHGAIDGSRETNGSRAAHGFPASHVSEILIPCLQDIQSHYGYLPRPVLEWVSSETGIPTARMYGVITFYSQFYLDPKGRHTIRCCEGTACHVKGAKRIAEGISEEIGVDEGGTTKDMNFTFETVQCLGTCFLAPVVMVDDDYYGEMTKDRVARVLKRYK